MTDIVQPTPIDNLPPAPEPTDTPAQFNAKGFATVAAQVAMIPQINDSTAKTYQNALATNELATAADASASAAALESDAAMGYRNQAGAHASAASVSAGQAAGSSTAAASSDLSAGNAATAAGLAKNAAQTAATTATEQAVIATEAAETAQAAASGQISGTSTTSVTPGTGVKNFTIETGRSFITGMYVVATSTSDTSITMTGLVQSYNGTTGALAIDVQQFTGSTAKADWAIGVAAKSANGLTQKIITANTTAIAGENYLFNSPSAILAMPSSPAHGDQVGFVLVTDVTNNQVVDFGSKPFRGQAAGQRYLNRKGFAMITQYNSTLGAWV